MVQILQSLLKDRRVFGASPALNLPIWFSLKEIWFELSRATLWMKPGCNRRDGQRGLPQNCSGPPTHVDTARVIVAGGLGSPGFLCISGADGCCVAGGTTAPQTAPSASSRVVCALQVKSGSLFINYCRYCTRAVVADGDPAPHSSFTLLSLLLSQQNLHFIHKISNT